MNFGSLRQRVWILVAVLVAFGGSAGAVIAARSIARNNAADSRKQLDDASGQITGALGLSIQHEEDLVVGAAAFRVENPHASASEFRSWVGSMKAFKRYPEVLTLGGADIVRQDQLAAFAKRVQADPPGPIPGGKFQVLPPGKRPFYCLSANSTARTPAQAAPVGVDFCAGSTGPAALGTRDTGEAYYAPQQFGATKFLGIVVPIYRGGSTPVTVKARQRAFIGWVGASIVPGLVIDRALQGHPGVGVAFRFRNRASNVVFRSGKAPKNAHSLTTDLHNGWTIRTSGAVASASVFDNGSALALLISGVVLSIVLGVLILVLATSRGRALRLVSQKTGELNYLAMHDALTGLPNRALVMDRAAQMLARTERQPNGVAALFIDVDGFKQINDHFGHAAGDRVLTTVGERLLGVVRGQDTVGRLGGDEFVVLLEGTTATAPPEMVAERLIEVLHEPIELDKSGKTARVSASIGIAAGRRETAGDLLRDADLALYAAKVAGKDRYVLFDTKMQDEADELNTLKADLGTAVEHGEFFLQYQPTFDLKDKRVVGVEALIRWQHPTRGVVAPEIFIPLAEETGLIEPIGSWVLQHACEQAAVWHEAGHPVGMSVNVSVVQLDSGTLVDEVTQALADSGLPAGSLTLEITETALMSDVTASAEHLAELKKLGVLIAIDDFGTGYSSLAYLRLFPIDALKIDRSFISGIATSDQSAAIIRTLVQLGKTLNIETLAEGIEEQDQLDQVAHEEVDRGQGFLYARPLDSDAVQTFLEEHSASATTLSTPPNRG